MIALTGNVGFWATLALNIPDFSRYARSQRDQVWGQSAGIADDDGVVFVHRRGGHVGGVCDLSEFAAGTEARIVGPGFSVVVVSQQSGAGVRDVCAGAGYLGDEHRRQRGESLPTILLTCGRNVFHFALAD